MLVSLLKGEDIKLGLNMQEFYEEKCPCERKSGGTQRRLGEPSGHRANLILSKEEREEVLAQVS